MGLIRSVIITVLLSTLIHASSQNLEKVSLQLNWKYQFEFAGFIAAKEFGFYKDVGLDVEIREFNEGTDVLGEVQSNRADYALYDSSLLRFYNKEKPIVLLSNYFKRSALVFVTKQDILTPDDLIGKKVMTSTYELQRSSLGTLLQKFSIPISSLELVPHSYSAKEFINGSVDVMSAFVSNELYDIKNSKVAYNIIDPVNYGIYGLGLNLFSTQEKTKRNPQQVEKFIDATNRGWKYALEHKKELVNLIYEKYSKIKSKDALLFEAKETEKLIIPKVYPIGYIDKKIIQDAIHSLKREKLIVENINVNELVYSRLDFTDSELHFSKEQNNYLLNKKEILMCVDPNWMPYEKIEKGKHIGITSEYIKLFSKTIGLPIRLVETDTWVQSLEYVKLKKCDILALASKTPTRLKYLNYSDPYLKFPIVLATKVDKLFITDIKEILEEKRIAIVEGYSLGENLKKGHVNNKIIDVPSVEAGMAMVSRGEVFGFLGAMPPIAHHLQKEYASELKITGRLKNNYSLGVAVRKDEPILVDIFNKAIHSIDSLAKQEILNKYISVKYEKAFDYDLFWKVFLVLVLLISYGLYRHKELISTKNKLENSNHNFEVLLNSVMEAIVVFHNEQCIDVNDVAVKMFGYNSKDEMIGLSVDDFAEIETLKIIKSNFDKDVDPYEVQGKRKNGETFDALVQGRNIIINDRKVRISTVVNTTTMKNQEKLLLQQSKMAAMGEMIDNIAHQWRQPLSYISTVSTGLELKLEFDTFKKDEALNELKNLNETTQHLSQTIDDFRNFFKSDKEKKDFYILKLIRKNLILFDGIFKNSRVKIILEESDDILIHNFKNELTQAILNILHNAKDAMLAQKSLKFVFITLSKNEDTVSIKIKDNGGGIKNSIMDKIFEPYFTTKHEKQGTGIGLYMTHQIIEKNMKGSVEASNVTYSYQNIQYTGAQFVITLPL